MKSLRRRALPLCFVWIASSVALLVACGDDDAPPPAIDAGVDGGETPCVTDDDCSDDVFCNGAERCSPSAAGADARGCAPSAAGACEAGRTCDESMDACLTACEVDADADGDSANAVECGGNDCDDGDARRYPGAAEVCDFDGVDEDCNPTTIGVRDADGDGFVDAVCCNGATCGDDCNDARADIRPGAVEPCDGIDNDCDLVVDDGVDVEGWPDRDFDGVGDSSSGTPIRGCPGALGFSELTGDCNDSRTGDPSMDPPIPPGSRQSPFLLEACDSIDNDCDGVVDNNTTSVNWFADDDADGFGDRADVVRSCAPISGRALIAFDCDDSMDTVNPAAPEVCDGRDNDCNGRADFVISGTDTEDDDRDGSPDRACAGAMGDCSDRDATTLPGAVELCDARDNDCDGSVDEGTSIVAWYLDDDRDGFGAASDLTPTMSCPPVPNRVTNNRDCNDTTNTISPGATELCDGVVDQNCDGSIAGEDIDGDLYLATTAVCVDGMRGDLPRTDCDDTRAESNPARTDVCNGLDDDCNGAIDGDAAALLCLPPASFRTATCDIGACTFSACNAGRGDCDATLPNCETDTNTSNAHCGACGSPCAARNACTSGVCTPTTRRVFVSSSFVSAVLGANPEMAADARCQSFATAASLGGTWRAWLSGSTSSPSTRFTRSAVPYVKLDGTIVANDWADLTDGSLRAAINIDELGAPQLAYEAWTGTTSSGTLQSAACANWSSAAFAARPFAAVGSASTGGSWTNVFLQTCERTNVRLLCFEQ